MRPRRIVRRTVIALTFVSATVTVMLWWWQNFGQFHVWQQSFEPVGWAHAAPLSEARGGGLRTVRSTMIDDLLSHHNFDGWTRQQLIGLLGEPTGEWSGFEQWDMVYVLGLERGGPLSLDDEALGFKFDAGDRVVKYGLSVN